MFDVNMNITEALDLHLHDFMHCIAAITWMADWIIAIISRGTGIPNKVTSACIH